MAEGYISGAKRRAFAYVPGLRAVAALLILAYELAKVAPAAFSNSLAHRAVLTSFHGFDLFFTISGFVLAAPLLASLRAPDKAELDVGRFWLDRAVRLLPAYYVGLAVTIALPFIAAHRGLVTHVALDPRSIALQALLLGKGLGNDVLRAVALQLVIALFFPALLAIYARRPFAFWVLWLAVVGAELLTPAHRLDLGAAAAFMLGIAAADIRARNLRLERVALFVAPLAAMCAFATDPYVASLPGSKFTGNFGTWNPLWSVAAAALVVAGSGSFLRRVLSLAEFTALGRLAYPMTLVAAPIAALVVPSASASLGVARASFGAAGIIVFSAALIWRLVDRHVADTDARRAAVAGLGRAFKRFFKLNLGTVVLVAKPLPSVEPKAHVPAVLQAQPAPIMHPGMLATVIERVGSTQDLAAEIDAIKRCLSQAALAEDPERALLAKGNEPIRVTAIVSDAVSTPAPASAATEAPSVTASAESSDAAAAEQQPQREAAALVAQPAEWITVDWALVADEMTHEGVLTVPFVETTSLEVQHAQSDVAVEPSKIVTPLTSRRATDARRPVVRMRFGPPQNEARAS